MLATKLRALLQRDKGRDLYDLDHALDVFPDIDVVKVATLFASYVALSGQTISRAQAQERMFGKLARGASDAALLSHHVDRSKLFIMERFKGIDILNPGRIARAVEGSRFPSSMPAEVEQVNEEVALLRAADLIGQLGDPHYIRKANALFYEFEEAGLNRQLGYESPADIVNKYPQFYWNSVAPYVQKAIRYLNVTAQGRQWVANLYSNVFRAERDIALTGPHI